jgi:hypothetical protein
MLMYCNLCVDLSLINHALIGISVEHRILSSGIRHRGRESAGVRHGGGTIRWGTFVIGSV